MDTIAEKYEKEREVACKLEVRRKATGDATLEFTQQEKDDEIAAVEEKAAMKEQEKTETREARIEMAGFNAAAEDRGEEKINFEVAKLAEGGLGSSREADTVIESTAGDRPTYTGEQEDAVFKALLEDLKEAKETDNRPPPSDNFLQDFNEKKAEEELKEELRDAPPPRDEPLHEAPPRPDDDKPEDGSTTDADGEESEIQPKPDGGAVDGGEAGADPKPDGGDVDGGESEVQPKPDGGSTTDADGGERDETTTSNEQQQQEQQQQEQQQQEQQHTDNAGGGRRILETVAEDNLVSEAIQNDPLAAPGVPFDDESVETMKGHFQELADESDADFDARKAEAEAKLETCYQTLEEFTGSFACLRCSDKASDSYDSYNGSYYIKPKACASLIRSCAKIFRENVRTMKALVSLAELKATLINSEEGDDLLGLPDIDFAAIEACADDEEACIAKDGVDESEDINDSAKEICQYVSVSKESRFLFVSQTAIDIATDAVALLESEGATAFDTAPADRLLSALEKVNFSRLLADDEDTESAEGLMTIDNSESSYDPEENPSGDAEIVDESVDDETDGDSTNTNTDGDGTNTNTETDGDGTNTNTETDGDGTNTDNETTTTSAKIVGTLIVLASVVTML